MSWLTDLRRGVAHVSALESSGLLGFDDPAVPELAVVGAVPIVSLLLPEQPDEAVALTLYTVSEGAESVIAAQFRFRAGTDARLDLIEDALQDSWVGRQAGTLNGVKLIMSQWSSGASLGQDSNERRLRSVNYYLTVNRPLRNRT